MDSGESIIRLHFARRDQASAIFMPQVVERLKRFCVAYDTDTTPAEIEDHAWRLFGAGDVRLGLWFITRGPTVVGHLLAQPEPLLNERGPWSYVLIRQAEYDRKIDLRKECRIVHASVMDWTKALGAKQTTMITHRNPKAMARLYKYSYYKTVMIRPVEKDEESLAN